MKHKCIAAIAAVLMAAGCTQPVRDYSYINLNRLRGWRDNTQITLNFDMTDTTNACQLFIVGEIAIKRSIGNRKGYPLHITLIAPDSTRYRDSITLPLNVLGDKGISRSSQGVKEIEWPYRKNIYNKMPGQWSMVFTKASEDVDYSNIIGLGVHCRENRL